MVKIGVDAVPLQKLCGGIGYYIFYLLDELIKHRTDDIFVLFVFNKTSEVQYFQKYQNVKIHIFPHACLGHSIWSQTMLSLGCWLRKIDIFWGTTQSIPLFKRSSMKTILSLYDFVYLICPETTSTMKKMYFQTCSHWMLRRASSIIPISLGTAQKLQQFYGLGFHEIVHPPLKPEIYFRKDTNSFLTSHSLRHKHYLIIIGTLEPRKNLEAILKIYSNLFKERSPDEIQPLVIVGSGGWKNKQLLKDLNQVKNQFPSHIRILGFSSNEEQALLLSGAKYCLLLSKYEGYGMPLAEARMCKTAVICQDQIEMREAAENDGIFLSIDKWQRQLIPYLLHSKKFKKPLHPTYPTNRDKALRLSKIIDGLTAGSCIFS